MTAFVGCARLIAWKNGFCLLWKPRWHQLVVRAGCAARPWRTLTHEQANLMRVAIANYRKAKKLLRAWEAQTQHLINLHAPA